MIERHAIYSCCCLLLNPGWRKAIDWVAWTTAGTILAIAIVLAVTALLDARPGRLGLMLAFFGYPAVIGLVMSTLTIRPLTAIAKNREQRTSNAEPGTRT